MNRRSETGHSRRWHRVALLVGVVAWAVGCYATGGDTGGETHFLRVCQPGSCGGGLTCLCGVCTRTCASVVDCEGLSRGQCVTPPESSSCSSGSLETWCDALCTANEDCASISAEHRCDDGRCRAGSSSDVGAAGSSGSGGAGGDGGATACPSGEVEANQVLVVGDSFLGATHQITAYLEDLARRAGALPIGERYRDHSSVVDNALAFGGNGLAAQYDAAVAEAQVEVVIMNGGGADAFLGSCATPTSDCAALVDASVALEQLLARMAADGVAHVVYASYPDALDTSLRDKVDAMRPLMEEICLASPVPCHWIDLRATFAGHAAEYLQPDVGVVPSAEGAEASAEAIWTTMAEYCVAQ